MFQLHQMSIRQHQVNIHGQIANCSLSQTPETLRQLEMRNNALEGKEDPFLPTCHVVVMDIPCCHLVVMNAPSCHFVIREMSQITMC